MSISERIRPGIEAAEWVCAEVAKLEVSYVSLRQQLEETQLRAESFEGSFNAREKQLAKCAEANVRGLVYRAAVKEQLTETQGELLVCQQEALELREAAAECQAREKVLRDVIQIEFDYQKETYDQPFSKLAEALTMPSNSTALDEALKQAKREALLDAHWLCKVCAARGMDALKCADAINSRLNHLSADTALTAD